MKDYFRLFLISILLVFSSCDKSADVKPVFLSGRWALVNEQQMTSEYISFVSNSVETFKTSKNLLVHECKIWNCSESDFKQVSFEQYDVINDILHVSGNPIGNIQIAGDTLIIAGVKTYLKFDKFESDAQSIITQSEFDCDYKSQTLAIPYKVSIPMKDVELNVSCESDWIKCAHITEDEICIEVRENHSSSARSAILEVSYPAAESVTLLIRQSANTINLAADGTANSYIVSASGCYTFPAVKGNGTTSVGAVSSAEVLWETFGTGARPQKGDLIAEASYHDGFVIFVTNKDFKKGNAVIAAKDASGTILWSWHIWFTDNPQIQTYNNDAGLVMDRNLGATTSEPGSVGSLGLLYQWGRKDPFLGSALPWSDFEPYSTLSPWPKALQSTVETGTIDYSVANPTIFITSNSNNNDWYFTDENTTDNNRWQSNKTIYDPCPVGYRVPDGDDKGLWATAFGTASTFYEDAHDETNRGFNFGSSGNVANRLTDVEQLCWYPFSGYRTHDGGTLYYVGSSGYFWSVSPREGSSTAYSFYYRSYGDVSPATRGKRAFGYSVRCVQE